jgi:nucleoside 2-deoxyribosyltransferase
MTQHTFEYNSTFGKIQFCGYEWDMRTNNGTVESPRYAFKLYDGFMTHQHIGEVHINSDAFGIINDDPDISYKVISLIYETNSKGKKYSIVDNPAKLVKCVDDCYSYITIDGLLKLFPASFLEKQQRALLNLYRIYPNYGEAIQTIERFELFAKDDREKFFILNSVIAKNILSVDKIDNKDGSFFSTSPFTITPEGWNIIEKSLHKVHSKQVFIAMSFAPEMKPAREAIRAAITKQGFEPLVIDEYEHTNYIPLEIQAKIKNSGLMVADFTKQNNGVYFETGYAMALNIPIIFCCKKNEFNKMHFDISQYNNILWENEGALSDRLAKRLAAVVGHPLNAHP